MASAGCTICPDPFDYSGPVPNGSSPQNDFRARSNGILPLGAAPKPWPVIVDDESRPSGNEPNPPLADGEPVADLRQVGGVEEPSKPDVAQPGRPADGRPAGEAVPPVLQPVPDAAVAARSAGVEAEDRPPVAAPAARSMITPAGPQGPQETPGWRARVR